MLSVRRLIPLYCLLALFGLSQSLLAADEADEGFEALFDGKTLDGWDGDPTFWTIEDGSITGETTTENPTKGNTFIVWDKGTVGDFELKLQYRIIPQNDKGFANSGIQYRSFRLPKGADKWRIGGYQADFEAGDTYSGILYGEQFRGILAQRGDKTVVTRTEDNKVKIETVGKVGDTREIQAKIKKEDWNDYHITAKGFHFVHKINGVVTSECTDNDEKERRDSGLLALQLHAGEPMKVQFRNIRLKGGTLNKKAAARVDDDKGAIVMRVDKEGRIWIAEEQTERKDVVESLADQFLKSGGAELHLRAPAELKTAVVTELLKLARQAGIQRVKMKVLVSTETKSKKVVLIAGKKSHGYGAHEHKAGCMLLAKALNESGLPIEATVVTEGWPQDASVLDGADSIVIYADGGGGHPFNAHIEEIDKLMKKGVGLVCLHYGVEVPKGKSGEAFLDWTGGYFETDWSVNPHWTAEYKQFQKHPITQGVQPFSIRDEWYYHMRFRDGLQDVTPILTDLPPTSTLVKEDGTLARPDNEHNNNPFVRKAVLEEKQPQHMAWARNRPDGGRGFGFTGGHDHWNWGHDQFRKLVLNAIAWTAQVEVPNAGVPSEPLTVKDLMANQDYAEPDNFNPARIQAMLDEWNRQSEN